jgi:hypothetical protein
MKYTHLSELEIQDCALNPSNCSADILKHLESCADCNAEVQAYRIVFSEIDQQNAPAFDFDVSALVMPTLNRTSARMTVEHFIAGFLVIFAACCIGIPLFIYRRNILYMFDGVPPFFIYSIVGSTLIIIITRIILMYRKFQSQMRFLNIN